MNIVNIQGKTMTKVTKANKSNSNETKALALEAIATLEKNQQILNKLAEDALNKYQPL